MPLNFKNAASLPRNIWVLGIASLLTDTSSEMIHAILPLFLVSSLGASFATVGLIEGLGESIASITKLFSGTLSDYIGKRKPLVVFGYAFSTAMKPLFAFAASPLLVGLARACDRIGKGIRGAPRDALVADSVAEEQRGAAYGLRQSLDTVGACIGPALAFGLMMASASNYRFIFLIALIPAVMAVAVLALGLQEKASAETAAAKGNPLRWEVLKSLGRPYWLLFSVALVFNLANSSDAFILLRLRQLGFAAEYVPLALVLMNITYAISAYPLGALSDKIGRFALFLTATLIYAMVYAGFGISQAVWQVFFFLAIYGIQMGAGQGALLAMVADVVPANRRGTAFGFINLATGITMLPASMLAGFLWDHVSPGAPFILGSAIALIAALLFCVFCRKLNT